MNEITWCERTGPPRALDRMFSCPRGPVFHLVSLGVGP